MPGSFFDTNVLVYLMSGDVRKADRVETLLTDGGAISVPAGHQVTRPGGDVGLERHSDGARGLGERWLCDAIRPARLDDAVGASVPDVDGASSVERAGDEGVTRDRAVLQREQLRGRALELERLGLADGDE